MPEATRLLLAKRGFNGALYWVVNTCTYFFHQWEASILELAFCTENDCEQTCLISLCVH